jgi:predicted DNA-binding transcriptional regulator AlpA
MTKTAEAARYLNEIAAARVLQISPRTLQRMRREGSGPAFIRPTARKVLYTREELDRWTATRTFPHRAAEMAQAAS